MLTRLKVSGFKNLVDVDVRFGAFTCIAGANGVGKSNLFDAIRFLSALAQMPLMEAALSIRDGNGKASDVRNLFHRVGDRYVDKMSFEAEMIIPAEGIGDLGHQIKAINTFVKYSLELGYKKKDTLRFSETLEILKEELIGIDRADPEEKLQNSHRFIFTQNEDENRYIQTYIGNSQPRRMDISTLNTTFLSLSELIDNYTSVLARQEMLGWQLLQLEPSPLRKPNEFIASNKLGTDGSNLAANFYHLVEKYYQQDVEKSKHKAEKIEAKVYAQASNRLAELIDDVDKIWVDRDDRRELLTLMVQDRYGTVYPASSLSDGTLRFLALTALELDPDSFRLLCLEEPENGIYPDRIPKILQLLQDMAVNFEEPIAFDNPLRQVIINTHSPVVVQQVPEDSLLVADLEETVVDRQRFKRACFRYLAGTWRDIDSVEGRKSKVISKGELLSYLNPVSRRFTDTNSRVIDRPDLQSLLPGN